MLTIYVDSSASMRPQKEEVLKAVNTMLNRYREDEKLELLLCTFSDTIETVFSGFICDFTEFTAAKYYTMGGTALYDAIADALVRSKNDATVIIATDGIDRDSKYETKESVAKKAAAAEKENGLRIIYIAEGIGASEAGKSMGLQTPLSVAHVGNASLSQQLASMEFNDLVDAMVALPDEEEPTKKQRKGDDLE
jgi:hypothetical protein